MKKLPHDEAHFELEGLEKELTILSLEKKNISSILELEKKSWIPALQASEESILERLENGHKILGIPDGEKLVSKICFSYSSFSPNEQDKFPKNFKDFSHQPKLESPNALFVYDFDIAPQYRGKKHAPTLMKAVLYEAEKSDCRYILVDGRPSSYNGSGKFEQEKVKQNMDFKNSIDRYLSGGRFPTDDEFMKDPTLALYKRRTVCKFLWILPNFIPEDEPAGGIRVILMKELERKSEISPI